MGFENSTVIPDSSITTSKIVDANVTYAKLDATTQSIFPPIGSVLAWAKSITGIPALPSGWVECNGQTLSDASSPINGQVIPNLNGNANFLYGNATSGSTKTENYLPSHTHNVPVYSSTGVALQKSSPYGANTNIATSAETSGTAWVGYSVVWIMRVK